MKKHNFLVAVSCLTMGIFSCQPQTPSSESLEIDGNREKAARLAEATNEAPTYDFQNIRTPVNFGLAGESSRDSVKILHERTMPRQEFVAKSGLPLLDPFRPMNNQNRDWHKADEKYRQFLITQRGHEFLPIFRRVGSVTILKDFALLADESKEGKRAIAFYTEELFDSGGENTNAPLVYYCLRALDGVWSSEKIKTYAERTIATNAKSDNLAQFREAPASIKKDMATAPPEMAKMMEQDIAILAQLVAEQDEYAGKLRDIISPRD